MGGNARAASPVKSATRRRDPRRASCLENRAGGRVMTLNQFRSWLYAAAKYSGDVQALLSPRRGAILRRIARRIAGNITGHALGKLFR